MHAFQKMLHSFKNCSIFHNFLVYIRTVARGKGLLGEMVQQNRLFNTPNFDDLFNVVFI